MSLLSVCIVVYKVNPAHLESLISSLELAIKTSSLFDESIEVLIINNGTEDELLKRVCGNFVESNSFSLEIVNAGKNLGYGRAHNIGIGKTTAKYHLIVNPDVVLDKASLEIGIKFLEENNDAIAICPEGSGEKGEKLYLAKSYPTVFVLFLRLLGIEVESGYIAEKLKKYELRDDTDTVNPVTVMIMSGCFMLCRSDRLKEIGGFDSRYFMYFEDFDLSMEMNKFGQLYYVPAMRIVHYGGNASKKGLDHIIFFIKSGFRFFNKYGWKWI